MSMRFSGPFCLARQCLMVSDALCHVGTISARTAQRNLALVDRELLRCSSPLGRIGSSGARTNRPAARCV